MRKYYLALACLVILVIGGGIFYYYETAPTWHLYYRNFGNVYTVEEFDKQLPLILKDIKVNFPKGTTNVDFSNARETVQLWQGTTGCNIQAACWLWEGNPNRPQWEIRKTYRDLFRKFDYNDKDKAYSAYFNLSSPKELMGNE